MLQETKLFLESDKGIADDSYVTFFPLRVSKISELFRWKWAEKQSLGVFAQFRPIESDVLRVA